jgi:hypothetical protein
MHLHRDSLTTACATIAIIALTLTTGCDRSSRIVAVDSPSRDGEWAARAAAGLKARGIHVEVQSPEAARVNTLRTLRAVLAKSRANDGHEPTLSIGLSGGRKLTGQDAVEYLEQQLHALESVKSLPQNSSSSRLNAGVSSQSSGSFCYIDGYSAGSLYDWSADAFSMTQAGSFGSGAMVDTEFWATVTNSEKNPPPMYSYSQVSGWYSAISSGNMVTGMGNVAWSAPTRGVGGTGGTIHSAYNFNPETGEDCESIMYTRGYF